MVTFEDIMRTMEQEQMGVVVRNCTPLSVAEARHASKNHPELELTIVQTKVALLYGRYFGSKIKAWKRVT